MIRIVGLLTLTGCPFIFGPPDLSNVSSDSAVDTATSVTTPTGTPVTTPTGTADPDAPMLSDVTAAPRFDSVDLSFRVDDPNGDLIGATVAVDQGSTVLQYIVPADLDLWSQFDVSHLTVPRTTPCEGYAEAWEVILTDAGGHVSPTVPVAATVRSAGIVPAGDTDIGPLLPPLTACGEIVQVDPKQEDRLFFTLAEDARLTFELRWPDPTADLDLYVFDGAVELGTSRGANPSPETVVVDLFAGVTYRLEIRYWEGAATTWQLFVRE
ncbi:MAG: hypothetical protein ACI8PZ_001135 [Myxococcota bacterium]